MVKTQSLEAQILRVELLKVNCSSASLEADVSIVVDFDIYLCYQDKF